MRAYYEQRAREYDDWWLGTGMFAGRDRPAWDEEVAELADVLSSLPPCRCLDVACGTGFLTRHVRGDVTALDQSASMVAIARDRLPAAEVVQGDALPLPVADGAFDRVVTGHFYGHLVEAESPTVWLPPESFRSRRALAHRVLPCAGYRRRLLWRYSLIWTKPSGPMGR